MKIYDTLHTIICRACMVLLPALCAPAALNAQSVEVTGISQAGDAAVMKARIDTQGKTPVEIVTRTFRMSDGFSTTCSDYELLPDGNVLAALDYKPGDYFYRMEVTFDDGDTVITDCYNAAFTEAAVWLSDLPVASYTCNEPAMDVCANGAPILLDGVTYYKGVSARPRTGNDYLEFTLPHAFAYARFVMGVQDVRADGSVSSGNARMEVYVNGSVTAWRGNMLAKSNPSCTVCKFDARWPQSGTMNMTAFKVVLNNRGDSTDDDCNLAAARLYYTVTSTESRTPQTVSFAGSGGVIAEDNPRVTLLAEASGGTSVNYVIVKGRDIATIENGNVLVPMAGKSGDIVVEAFTLGDDTYAPASAQLSFRFNFGPTVQYLASYHPGADPSVRPFYLYVDPRDKVLEKLSLTVYDNIRNFNEAAVVDVLPLIQSGAVPPAHVVELQLPAQWSDVHRLAYKFAGEEEMELPLAEGLTPFVYMSDLPYSISTGWGSATRDIAYGSAGPLTNTLYTYAKGFGFHANGYVATTGDLSAFDRFAVDVAGQIISNPTRGRLAFSLVNGSTTLANTGNISWQTVTEWDFPIDGTAAVRINGNNGGDGNSNDVIAVGAPRFYYITEPKQSQTIEWGTEPVDLANYKPFETELDASATSGRPVIYRVIKGMEFASVADGNKLVFSSIPREGEVVVEALQPGDVVYGAAPAVTRTFRIRKDLVVGSDERVEIEGGSDIGTLTVYADSRSAGQVLVRDGIVNVGKLELKYTFVPGEWNYISFPVDADLDAVSNLNEKGYYHGNDAAGNGAYIVKEFDTRARAEVPEDSPWTDTGTSAVKGLKGYIMMLDAAAGTEPVEITFTFDNMALDFESSIRPLYLTLDMTQAQPGSVMPVYVKPLNVKGNTLKVNVRFDPADLSALPVDHARALEQMRVTFTPDRRGIRLTLPDQTPAKVAVYRTDGMTLVKAVRYVSPMMIDMAGIPSGSYTVVVGYGAAVAVRNIEL